MIDKWRILAVEIRQRLGHLSKHERFLMEGELLLTVILQVRAKTGVHLLHHEHRQARSAIHMHPQELDHAGVTQVRPRQAIRLELADQFATPPSDWPVGGSHGVVWRRTPSLSSPLQIPWRPSHCPTWRR